MGLTEKEGKIKELKEMVKKLEEDGTNKIIITDKEKVIKEQKKFIEEMEKDVALKKEEIETWRRNCVLFWHWDPNTVFDPKNPNKAPKAERDGDEGVESEIDEPEKDETSDISD